MDEFIASIIATAGASGAVHVWDTAVPETPVASVRCGSEVLALEVTASRLLACCANGSIKAWPRDGSRIDLDDDSLVSLQVASEGQSVTCAAVAPGAEVYCGTSGGVVHRMPVRPGATPSQTLAGHSAAVLSCCLLPPDAASLLASASADGTCRVWDTRSGACVCVLQHEQVEPAADSAEPGAVAVNAVAGVTVGGAALLLTGASDGAVRVWDARAVATGGAAPPPPLAVLREHADGVLHCAATSKQLVSCSADASVKFWSWGESGGALEHSNYDFIKAVTRVKVAAVAGDEVLFAVGEEGVVRGWNVGSQQQVVAVDVEVVEDDNVQLNDIVVLSS